MRILLIIALLFPAQGFAEPLDRVVAVVGDQLVLSSDIDLLSALQDRDPHGLPIWAPSATIAVDTAAIRELAGDVSVYAPRPDQVSARLDSVRDAFDTYGAFNSFLSTRGMTEADLHAVLRRRLVVEKFIQRNVDISQSDPNFAAEVQRMFSQARERVVIRVIDKKSP